MLLSSSIKSLDLTINPSIGVAHAWIIMYISKTIIRKGITTFALYSKEKHIQSPHPI